MLRYYNQNIKKPQRMTQFIKKMLRIFPSDFPNKIYNILIVFPPFAYIINSFIKSRIPESINIPEGKIFLNKSDVGVSGALALGSFERTEIDIFRLNIKPGMNVVDIGANIGYYTVIASNRVGINGKVFSYEPEPANLRFLRKNVTQDNINNVIIENHAISDKSGSQTFYLTKENKGTHSLVNNRDTKDTLTVQ